MQDETVFLVEVTGPSLTALRAFADEFDADLGCRPIAKRYGADFVLAAYLRESQLASARPSPMLGDVRIRLVANQTQIGAQRQREVGDGNRFAARVDTPRGLGRKV